MKKLYWWGGGVLVVAAGVWAANWIDNYSFGKAHAEFFAERRSKDYPECTTRIMWKGEEHDVFVYDRPTVQCIKDADRRWAEDAFATVNAARNEARVKREEAVGY